MRLLIACCFFILLAASCKKDSTPPFKMTIQASADSLTLLPVIFSAIGSETAESYTWHFGDGIVTTTTTTTIPHVYQQMGNFSVYCVASIRGVKDTAYIFSKKIKGDSRIIGTRRFYGTHRYSTSYTQFGGIPINFITVNIVDTTLLFTAPNPSQLAIFGIYSGGWEHDTGIEVQYQGIISLSHEGSQTYFQYYPANDSAFVYHLKGGFGAAPESEWKLYQKR